MKTTHISGIAVLVAGLTAGVAWAQGPGSPLGELGMNLERTKGEMPGRMAHMIVNDPKVAAELGLKEDQLAALKASVFELRKTIIDLNAKMELAAVNQAELMSAQEIDEAAVMKAVEETGRMRTEIAKANIRNLIAMRKVLTPEQRLKLRDLMRKRADKWQDSRTKRGERGASMRRDAQNAPDNQVPPPPPPPVQ